LFGIGDVIAQGSTVEKHESWDLGRIGRAVIYGGVIFAPIGTKWYPLLNRIQSKNQVKQTALRVCADQLGFAPFVGIPLYFSAMAAMEGKSPNEIATKVKNNYKDTLLANWTIWPAVQLANFSMVPVHYRLLTVNLVSIAWNAFLSLKNSSVHTM
jgi:hypothetical protein